VQEPGEHFTSALTGLRGVGFGKKDVVQDGIEKTKGGEERDWREDAIFFTIFFHFTLDLLPSVVLTLVLSTGQQDRRNFIAPTRRETAH